MVNTLHIPEPTAENTQLCRETLKTFLCNVKGIPWCDLVGADDHSLMAVLRDITVGELDFYRQDYVEWIIYFVRLNNKG